MKEQDDTSPQPGSKAKTEKLNANPDGRALLEGRDYYLNEQGLMVLTEQHHLNRGYCCGMGCKHCPYDYKAVPEPKRSALLQERKPSDK